MSDSIAADLLKSLIDRILRLREEEDAIKDDIREVYAEAKSHGFDKTILGKTVARLRAEAKDGDKLEETEALLELYLNAYRAAEPSRAHTHAGAREDRPAAEAPRTQDGDAPGYVDPKLIETVVKGVQTEIGRKALTAALDVMIEREERQTAQEPSTPPAVLSAPRPPMRPHCLKPEACAGVGRNHCHTCTKTAEKEGIAA